MLTIQLSSTQLTDKIKLSLLFTALRENIALTIGFLKGKKGWVTEDLKFGLRQGRASPVAQLGIHLQCGRPGFYPWVGKILWRRERLSTPVVWPGEFPGLYSHRIAKSLTRLINFHFQFSSVQFSRSVVSDSLWPQELQHARPPCQSPTPRVYPNLCPLSQWCHPTISSSVMPFSSCPPSFRASGSFQMSQLFAPGGQSIGVSASTSVLPMNTQDWSPLGWTGWISLQSKGLSRVFSNTTVQKHQFSCTQLSL